MANTSIYRNITSTGNSDICTISCWFKKDFTGAEKALFGGWRSSTDRFQIRFKSDDTIDVEFGYGGSWYSLITNRKFRDPSAWMHLVLAIDSTQGTPANREKLYINGVQETSFSTEVYMPQNNDTLMTTSGDEVMIGSSNQTSGSGTHQGFWKGCMSHVQFVDGLALAPTVFGETDATSGIWKIKTGAYATPGTNGFFLKMEDSTNIDLDSSSNSLTFTTEGTLTATKDNPSNNFVTMNPLDNKWMNGSFSNGNTTVTTTSAEYGYNTGTLGASSGKFYWEMKMIDPVDSTNYVATGIAGRHPYDLEGLGYRADAASYQGNNGYARLNGTASAYGNSYTTNDIIGVAMDLDNSKLYFSKNGTWQNSGDPTSGSTGTGAVSITAVGSTKAGFYFPAVSDHAGSSWTNAVFSFNFGNGYFGTTAITSAGTNASGNGTFEYDVPTGFTALCTKGINS